MDERKLLGKVALITGGGRGIGRAIGLEFARNGADILVADIDLVSAEDAAAEIERTGVRAGAIRTDVSNAAEVQGMVEAALRQFARLDILVNNAGIYLFRTVEACTEEEWDRVLAVNLKGVFLCSRAVMGPMKAARTGRILSISSIAGKTGGVRSSAPYAASKAGVICLTKSLAHELAPFGITVNALCPGIIRTEMTKDHPPDMVRSIPLARFGEPEEIARCALFLVSDDAAYITGEIVDVNGGMLMD